MKQLANKVNSDERSIIVFGVSLHAYKDGITSTNNAQTKTNIAFVDFDFTFLTRYDWCCRRRSRRNSYCWGIYTNKKYVVSIIAADSPYSMSRGQYLHSVFKGSYNSILLWLFPDEGPMLETLDHTIRIGSTPTFLYFDLYLYSAYAAHYV